MSVDTRNSIIAIIAAGTMAGLLLISLVGILILAIAHDGELANHALDTFNQIIVVVVPAMAALAGVHQIVSGLTASKALSSTALVQVAQASNGSTSVAPGATSSEPVSSPAGVNADVPAEAVAAVAGEGV